MTLRSQNRQLRVLLAVPKIVNPRDFVDSAAVRLPPTLQSRRLQYRRSNQRQPRRLLSRTHHQNQNVPLHRHPSNKMERHLPPLKLQAPPELPGRKKCEPYRLT
jgi:hypothetical protein